MKPGQLLDIINRRRPSLSPSARQRVKRIILARWDKVERKRAGQPVQMELLYEIQTDGRPA